MSDTVTLSRAEYERLVALAEDAVDLATVEAAVAREADLGKAEARSNHLTSDEVLRLIDGEHPIRVWREHRGLSVDELASTAGIAASLLAEMEARTHPGTLDAVKAVAKALDLSLDIIVE